MSKKICEKTLFNVLFYRMHKRSFTNFEMRHLPKLQKSDNTNAHEWVKDQTLYIENHGLDDWLQNTNAPYGMPQYMKSRPNPYLYTIKFRTNIFYT